MKPSTLNESPAWSITGRLVVALLAVQLAAVSAHGAMSAGFNRLLDAVVRIDVREVTFEQGARRLVGGVGSGVILSGDGLVLTNAHVANPFAVEILITLPSLESVGAKLVGWDHWTDLALIRLDSTRSGGAGSRFDRPRSAIPPRSIPGETIFAVGTPFGLTRTVTCGIISNDRRYFEDNDRIRGYETGTFNTWLQTDAAINPGNSGGPLVTEDGKVVGINSRGYVGADNLGFAIPSSDRPARRRRAGGARQRHPQLHRAGSRTLQDLEHFYALALNTGMLINSVDPGIARRPAGLRSGDILLAINGQKVDGRFPEQLPADPEHDRQPAGRLDGPAQHQARGQTIEVPVVTEKLESRMGEEWAFEKWGLSVRKVSRAYARENQLDDDTGVMVIGVQAGFPGGGGGPRGRRHHHPGRPAAADGAGCPQTHLPAV